MTKGLTGWEKTRLSKHFILLDFLADHTVYRSAKPLVFHEIWNDEHGALARSLCNDLLEPLMRDERFGPISIADAFWPLSVFPSKSGHLGSGCKKHRWTGGEATVDIALYRLVDNDVREGELRKAVLRIEAIDGCRDRVMSYPETEFVCVTFKREGAEKCGRYDPRKTQNLRAHHVRVGRHFNLLDFCRSGRAVEGRRRSGAEERRKVRPRLHPDSRGNSRPLLCPPRWIRWWTTLVEFRSYAGWRRSDLPMTVMRSCIAGTGMDLGGWSLCCLKGRIQGMPAIS